MKNNVVKALFSATCSFVLVACASQPESQERAARDAVSACVGGSIERGDCKLSGLPALASEPSDDLWSQVVGGYQLQDYAGHSRVKEKFEFYRSRPQFLQTIAERSNRYLHFIVEAIRERDMPMEFALLPAIESSYDPFAYSHGRAAGLWQFVPGTARDMGLPQTWWYDGRRDVVASTEAALDYLQELHGRFEGDWLLALAAYNSGATTVNRAIARNQQAGLPTDYWSLPLPTETRGYIPKLMALSQLLKRAPYEGIELPVVANAPAFSLVETGGQIDLAQAAELADITIEELYMLNPGYNRWATDPDGPHRLAVPVGNQSLFEQRLAEIPADRRLQWSRYTVEPGDSLIRIARRFNTDVNTIKAANKLNNHLIRVGQVLLLPSASMATSHYTLSAGQRRQAAQQRGGSDNKASLYHKVVAGDSLWSISRHYGVSVAALASWNDMVPKDPLLPGRKLIVWLDNNAVALRTTESRSVVRRVGYTVRQGDSLARIAQRFSVRINDIVEWNQINAAHYLMPGQVLSLYVDVTRMSGH